MSTAVIGRSKDDVARRLAESHYQVDPAISRIIRIVSPQHESDADEPIKLLEVNEDTTMSGIVPIRFGAHEPSGIYYSSIIIEIRPEELEPVKQGELALPEDWQLGSEYSKPEPQ
jgi:hypothetical protein